MSLSNYAKRKALDFATQVYNQADPSANTSTGSAIKALLLLPFSLIYAAVFQDIELLRVLYLGNFAQISEGDMDSLAGNLLVSRPQGSRSLTNLKLYLPEISTFTLDTFPYFETVEGNSFKPIRPITFTPNDFFEENGEFYVNVPVISTRVGTAGEAVAGEITNFVNLPVEAIRVNNEQDSRGASNTLSNSEFFEFIQDSVNDGGLNQVGGAREYILTNYPEVSDIEVIDSNNPLLTRDEVWTEDGTNPNLERLGEPFATHTDIGTLDFDREYGRAYSAAGNFTADMENKRIAITGDSEKFRLVLKVIDENFAIYSGDPLEGSATAKIWGDGPKIKTMSDIYVYFPNFQIQSSIVDKRYQLQAFSGFTQPIVAGSTVVSLYYEFADGFSYDSLPDSGKVVIREGLVDEVIFDYTGSGSNVTGNYITGEGVFPNDVTVNIGDSITIYDMGTITIGEDIEDRPILYVLQVESLDPLSFEPTGEITRSQPGNYSEPGWYISNTDSAEIFSAREVKDIVLDSKSDSNAFVALNQSASVTDSSSRFAGSIEDDTGVDQLTSNSGWSFTEGREISVSVADYALTQAGSGSSISAASVSAGAGTGQMTITGLNVQFDSSVGYRDDLYIIVYNSSSSQIAEYKPGLVNAYGDKIELKTGSFPAASDNVDVRFPYQDKTSPTAGYYYIGNDDADIELFSGGAWNAEARPDFDAFWYTPGVDLESVVLSYSGNDAEIYIENGSLPAIEDSSGVISGLNRVTVTAESEVGDFSAGPVRVVYVTQFNIQNLQEGFDSSSFSLLCKDTLVRAFLPSIIDATIRYTGSSSSSAIFTRFVELVENVVSQTDDDEIVRIDISNIIAALDDEGYTDSIDVGFEVRVTNYLTDGEKEVGYLNPSDSTKQQMVVNADVLAGPDRITLKRDGSTATPPGRGKLFLGGRNPNAQEVRIYEAVIDNGDDTLTFIFRNGEALLYNHDQWEIAYVTVRDYDPQLEYTDGAIFIPKNNRPYVRDLVVIKK